MAKATSRGRFLLTTVAPTALRGVNATQAKSPTARKRPARDAKLSDCWRNPEETYDAN
jgi:hypothetical protein